MYGVCHQFVGEADFTALALDNVAVHVSNRALLAADEPRATALQSQLCDSGGDKVGNFSDEAVPPLCRGRAGMMIKK